jgi:hypothetical protein
VLSRILCRAILVLIACPFAGAQVAIDSRHAAELLGHLGDKTDRLQCEITAVAPSLTFSFRFQAGYMVRLPLRQFHGAGHSISVLMRVTPAADSQPVYLLRRFDLPDVPNTDYAAELAGAFLLGEGYYQANAILFDDTHRVCRADWQIAVRAARAERDRVLMPPNRVAPLSQAFAAAKNRKAVQLNRITIFLHAASLNSKVSKLQARDVVTEIGALSALLEELPARAVRLVVFNLHEQKELYRNEEFTVNDLEQVERVLDGVQSGLTVDYRALQHPEQEREVLRNLIHREANEADRADSVIFLGPDGTYGRQEAVPASETFSPGQRVFYLQFLLDGALFAGNRVARMMNGTEPRPAVSCQNVDGSGCASLPSSGPPSVAGAWSNPGTPDDADAIATVVRKLKGKILLVRTASDFSKAVDHIGAR